MKFSRGFSISLFSFFLLLFFSSIAWSADSDRWAQHVKMWPDGATSSCCSGCQEATHSRSMVEAWMDEVVTHSGWNETIAFETYSYACLFYDADKITGGYDHLSYGFDSSDAVMVGLHGMLGEHDGKYTYRARVKDKLNSYESTDDFCKAWLSYYNFGDDNDTLDLEWLHLVSCHAGDSNLIDGSASTYYKWINAFDGLNSVTMYAGESWASTSLGEDLAEDFYDNIEDSWTINNYTTSTDDCDKDDCTESSGQKRCPVWLSYNESTAANQALMLSDDYTTRASEPPGHGGNSYWLRSRYSSCDACCENEVP
jgi:hypothetical protein